MDVYVVSSVCFDCGEFQGHTVWGVFKSKEEAIQYIEDENIREFEINVSIDKFSI